ncbi:hypothetical protein [Natrinema salaciae]|uniref:hypothetical protein n=1 Tax=Natrinema salaciae TaxID=1186196 RepID=UPI001587C2EE|nr:hypothetical protein [Natrinema salaciae]
MLELLILDTRRLERRGTQGILSDVRHVHWLFRRLRVFVTDAAFDVLVGVTDCPNTVFNIGERDLGRGFVGVMAILDDSLTHLGRVRPLGTEYVEFFAGIEVLEWKDLSVSTDYRVVAVNRFTTSEVLVVGNPKSVVEVEKDSVSALGVWDSRFEEVGTEDGLERLLARVAMGVPREFTIRAVKLGNRLNEPQPGVPEGVALSELRTEDADRFLVDIRTIAEQRPNRL